MQTFVITGQLVNQHKAPLSGLRVEAWDKDLICDDLVGSTISDDTGAFSFSFTKKYFSELFFDRKPDLFFKVFDGDQLLQDTRKNVLWNVGKKPKKITITIKVNTSPQTPPELVKEEVLELLTYQQETPENLAKTQPKVYQTITQKALRHISQEVQDFFNKSSEGVQEFVKAINFSELEHENAVKEYVGNIIEHSKLDEESKNEGVLHIQSWDGTENLNALIQPKTPIRQNVFLQKELQHAKVYQISTLANFDDQLSTTLVSYNLQVSTITPETITNLIDNGVFSKEQGEVLLLNANVYAVASEDIELSNAIKNYNNIGLQSIEELAPLEVNDWVNIIRNANSDDDALIETRAQRKQKLIETLYPNQVFRARSRVLEETGVRDLMEQFYETNTSFNFLQMNFDEDSDDWQHISFGNFSDTQQQTIIDTLKSNKRLYKITGDATHALQLKTNYRSANEIVGVSFPEFLETTSLDEPLARRYYENARNESLGVNIALGNILDQINNPLGGSMIDNISTDVDGYLRRINGYEEFFGETDHCKCKHCASIISPVAYFMDLMTFLQHHVMDAHFPDSADGPIISPRRRRPDLWSALILNCNNTHELIPYLTIINELLENFIYAETHDDVASLPDRTEIENSVYELLSFIGADPLMIDSFKQPFNLPLKELEIYLEHFPMSRHSLAKTLLENVPHDAPILPQSFLELSAREYQLLLEDKARDHVGEDVNHEFLERLYKVDINEDNSINPVNVQDILGIIGIDREEFAQLIQTYFVNPRTRILFQEIEIIGEYENDNLQITIEKIHHLTIAHLDRMHRFVRLWKQLDWSIIELDKVIENIHFSFANPASIVHELFPEKIVQVVQLQKEFKIEVDQLCALIRQISVGGDPSFFDLLFNLPAFVKEETDRWVPSDLTREVLLFQHPSYRSTGVSTTEETTVLHRLLAGLRVDNEQLFSLIQYLQEPLQNGLAADAPVGSFEINVENLSILYRHALLVNKLRLTVDELFFFIRISDHLTAGYLQDIDDIQVLLTILNWQKESKYSPEELSFIIEEPLMENTLMSTPEEMSHDIWEQIQEDQSLLFRDTLFSYFEGISESQSRAIVEANPSSMVPADLRRYQMSAITHIPETFNINIPSEILDRLSVEQRIRVIGSILNLISVQILNGTSTISNGILSLIEGLSEADSQAILNANTDAIFTPVSGTADYEINPTVLNDPSTINITIPSTIWSDLSLGEQQTLYGNLVENIARYILPGAPELSDRTLVGTGTLDLAQSRTIITANASLFEAIEDDTLYWLHPDFDVSTMINVPGDIPLPITEAQEIVLGKHVSSIISNLLEDQLEISSDKIMALSRLGGYNLLEVSLTNQLTQIAQGTQDLTTLMALVNVLQRLSIWFKDSKFTPDTIEFVRMQSGDHTQLFQIRIPVDYREPTISLLQQIESYRKLLVNFNDNTQEINTVLSVYNYDLPQPAFQDTIYDELASLLGLDPSIVSNLNQTMSSSGLFPIAVESGVNINLGIKALHKFIKVIGLVQFLGIGAEALPLCISNEFNDLKIAVKALVTAIRTKYDTEEAWQEKIGPFEDEIRELKRDALTDYLMNTYRSNLTDDGHWFKTTKDLYNYFLIDTELEGCARTSRVVAGISSLQLYIQRCLMNLEQTEEIVEDSGEPLHYVSPTDIPLDQWEWRKNYRVWEANRKVFLYPENYIEPDLRDNKTELFRDLESELLQKEITAQNALDAYGKYMKGFEEISNLKIAGAYHDLEGNKDTLHVFGVSNGEAKEYYYRTVRNIYKSQQNFSSVSVTSDSWKKLQLQIPTGIISPIIYNERLYLFWSEISTRPLPESEWEESNQAEYKHIYKIKYTYLRLDDAWETPRTILFEEIEGLKVDSLIVSESTGTSLNENYTKQDWDWVRIFPSIDERTGNLTLANELMNHTIVLFTGERGESLRRIDSYTPSIAVKRLLKEETKIGYWYSPTSSYAFKYFWSSFSLENDFLYSLKEADLVEFDEKPIQVIPVNGSLSDVLVLTNNDLLYVHCDRHWKPYAVKRLGTTLVQKMSRQLFSSGIDGFMAIDYQRDELVEEPIKATLNLDAIWNDTLDGEGASILFTKGFMGTYFREIFFHIPFLIANHLNSQKKFEDAQRWYHYIFDPTSNKIPEDIEAITDPIERKKRMADRVWQFIEFRDHTLQNWKERLNDQQAVNVYKNDPFNPHAIARLRLGAYMKSITMKYIDNLLDWGDHLFAQDTMESINEATLLYMLACEILGKKPVELGDCEKVSEDQTYEQLYRRMNGSTCRSFLNNLESNTQNESERPTAPEDNFIIPTPSRIFQNEQWLSEYFTTAVVYATSNNSNTSENAILGLDGPSFVGDVNIDFEIDRDLPFDGFYWKERFKNLFDLISFHTSFLKQTCLFCIPPNPDLLVYWDRVDDRLFKIRNCLNISGVRRQIPLFAPEIDPRLLVRAKAAGLSLSDILNSINGDLPPYRFAFLLAKAKEYAGALQSFGGALLGALEKKSAEELTLLRLSQQDEILKMTSRLRDMEVKAAETSLEGLRKREITITSRRDYYQNLITTGRIGEEQWQNDLKITSYILTEFSVIPMIVSSGFQFAPKIIGFSNSTPTSGVADGGQVFASVLQYLAGAASRGADLLGMMAAKKRREQGWQFSLKQAENELKEIEKQIEAATIRRDISIKSRELHEKSIEQLQETYEFYRDRFTNLGLYTWLSSQLQRLYREAYQNAMTIARMAERAYRFERNDDTTVLLNGSYWNNSRAGLLSGEKLMNALRSMELRYMETNTRSMEIDQAFSLTQINPSALLQLKETGICEFTVPELYFDLFYPGQYRRKIKSARLTIPCITGPYSNVSVTLTLKSSYIRKEAKLDEGSLSLVPASRSTTVATSTAQNDSGVFRLDFRDERYMPFEGAGAVESTWQLELPKKFRPFDYATINDAILHISYTADYDTQFREEVEGDEGVLGRLDTLLQGEEDFILQRVFSIRQEFSQTFHRLLHSEEGETVPLELSEKHFPLFLQGKRLEIESAKLILEIDENGFRDDDGDIVIPTPINVGMSIDSNGTIPTTITHFNNSNGVYEADLDANTFTNFLPVHETLRVDLTINSAGDLAPEISVPSDPSALDDHKIKDVYLYLNYRTLI
ncbi:neuraminidase-like domain-containing protein [Aquimarina sp. D1M17]|uniref:Tc toxin subunit A-related protein n=1 Tax=Aquimarina acroporae TaxID=2937283 RepID=UPI0020BE4EC3|nr:neuraminidase-like domain-containing protein [Aquimarina acroporae]MCK8521359.1 neuraminidase-like domain-containing protein [Aquimarina acroporae]